MPKEKEKETNTNITNNNNNNSISKTFYADVLNKIANNNIITLYTKDRLLDLLNSDNKKNYLKFKRHFNDLLSLQESFEED